MSWGEVAVTHLGPRAETGREEVGRLVAGGAGQPLASPGPGPGSVPPAQRGGLGAASPLGAAAVRAQAALGETERTDRARRLRG